ncbi:MAG TPA: SprT-like domain-containing protein [Bryobacteraceae bacterium]|nr:SprT-like domain-containing protein [Bryobacteraceae bacterium]
MALESLILFETPEQLFARVFRELKPRTAVPRIQVEYCRFANANSLVRLDGGRLHVRITDVLQGAPSPILEALAHILISRLYRREPARAWTDRYRRYLNRKDMRRLLQIVRQERGHKLMVDPRGHCYDLVQIFEELNLRYFHGLMARPDLGWSRCPSRTTLGHYDPSHNTIVLSSILDRAAVPRLAVEYVMFHEMLHLRFPVDHRGARRCVHTPEFKTAEKQFEQLTEAKEMLRSL